MGIWILGEPYKAELWKMWRLKEYINSLKREMLEVFEVSKGKTEIEFDQEISKRRREKWKEVMLAKKKRKKRKQGQGFCITRDLKT